jgi:hypothetical protein
LRESHQPATVEPENLLTVATCRFRISSNLCSFPVLSTNTAFKLCSRASLTANLWAAHENFLQKPLMTIATASSVERRALIEVEDLLLTDLDVEAMLDFAELFPLR